jgi:hypothetical protein
MVTPPAVYQCLADTIDGRLGSLPADAGSGEPGPPAAEADELGLLAADRAMVRLHSDLVEQPVAYGAATFCRECGEPAPCETIRDLAVQYGCDVVG